MLQTIADNIQTIGAIAVTLVTVSIAITMKVKEFKVKIEKAIVDKDYAELLTLFNDVKSNVLDYIEIAENSGMSGIAKKSYVKSQVVLLFNSQGLSYDDKQVDILIERFIEFSNKVNVKKGTVRYNG